MGPLDEAELERTTANHLVDFVEEGAPLIITFGFYFATGTPQFEFLGRLRKLEQVSGRRINKLLVRDPSMRWYLGGIEGLGDDVPSTVEGLRAQIERLQPSSVITVGQSMGAYAAILYGTLLGVEKAVPFGPLSCFDRRIWDLISDRRWMQVLDELEASGIPFADYADLPKLIQASPNRPDIDLIYGSYPGPNALPNDAIGPDAAHAVRFADCENVTLLPIVNSFHAVVEHFRSQGVITDVLNQRIFGAPLLPTIQGLHGESWVAWLLENLQLGSTYDALRPVMLGSLTADQADGFIAQSRLLADLARLQDTPPVVTI